MYGQGNYAPQFRHGPPPPPLQQAPPGHPAPFQQTPPGLPPPAIQHGPPPNPQIHQAPSGLPSVPYQHAPPVPLAQPPLHFPPPPSVNMGQPYIHPHESAPMFPSYAQPGTSYHPPMLSQNAHQVPQQMPPPPRMFLPPPPPSQGQILYRTSPLPPLGIQHVPTPPPPPPSNFVSITPAPFVPFGNTSLGDAHPPSLPPPPPPPPPASPPPLSPSPTPPAPPMVELPTVPEAPSVDSGADVTPSFEHVTADAPVTSAQSVDNDPVSGSSHIGEVDNAGKKVALVEREVSGDFRPPPPKPIEEVVRNIEVLCQFIAKVGPEFEKLARTKEAGNPKFAFLFGGAPGSAAAVGYEYFQWMKGKYRFAIESHKDPERLSEMVNALQYGNLENEVAVCSPSTSDMDMEDDVGLPGGDAGLIKLNTEPTGESASLSSGRHVFEEPAPRSTTEHVQEGAVPSTASCSGPSSFLQDKREDDKDSSFIEDVSPVRPLPGAAECAVDGNMQQSVRLLTQDSSWVNVMPTAACGKTAETPRVFVKDGSPFRLIQGYASDDSGEDDDKKDYVDNINPVRTSPSVAVGSSGLQKDEGYEMPSNFSPKSVPETERSRLRTDSSRSLSPMPKEAATFGGSSPQKSPKQDDVFSNPVDAIENVTDLSIHKQHDHRLHDKTGNHEPSEDSDVVGDKSINVDNQVTRINTEDAKQDSTAPTVDEFGRLVREGVSDSDSDGIHYNERHGNRVRSRSRSRSRSPQQSRRRQRSRSPRRRDKRSRSRSWSPRRRSKSPLAYRRTTLFAKADRDQPPECFNFIRGRCFRGASCRFLHRDVGYHRRRQPHYKDFAQGSDKHDVHDDALVSENCYRAKSSVRNMDVEKLDDVDLEATKSPKMQTDEKLSKASTKITHDDVLGKKVAVDAVTADALPSLKNDAGEQQITDHGSQNIVTQVKEPQQLEILQKAPKIYAAEEERTQPLLESSQTSPAQKSECLISETVLGQPNTEGQAVQAGAFQNQVPCIRPYSEHAVVSQACQSQSSGSHSHSNCGLASQPWNQSLLPGEFSPPRVSVPDTKSQPSQLLPPAPQGHPPPFFPADSTTAPCASEHPRENLLPPVTSYHLHRPPLDMLTSHQPPVASDYHSQSMHLSNSMWPNPPLPPPSYVNGLPGRPAFPATEFLHMQFQQNTIPPRNDFSQPSIRPYPPGELTRSQAVDFRHQPFQSMESSHHPPLHMDEFKWRPLPMGNQQNQPFPREDWLSCPPPMPEGSRSISDLQQKDYHLHHQSLLHDDVQIPFPGQGPSSSKSYSQGTAVFPPALSNRSESFPGDRLPPRFFSKEEFPSVSNLPYSHPPYGQQRSASPNFPSNLGGPGMTNPSLQRLSSNFSESNLPRQLSDIGAPNMSISTHYNPFASTFEEAPGSLKFGSSKYDSLFSSGHDPLGGSGSRLKASPPNLRRSGEQFLPRSAGYSHETSAEALPDAHNQFVRDPASGVPYDPLFDSIETSSNMLKKLDRVQEQNVAANDAGMVPKVNSLMRPADVEDSNRQKDSVGAELKSEVDEFGEVATDAEVGAVENESPQQVDGKNWSPVIPHEVGNTAAGEIEIDQVRSPGKKKSKESRSMKLLKIALADFVKEVLKPSWRQGNMSKEAFKTIVKKTVDKVSGAIPSNQIPKTQAKINQYVESSQRKLTKLVMAYVDKYVKM